MRISLSLIFSLSLLASTASTLAACAEEAPRIALLQVSISYSQLDEVEKFRAMIESDKHIHCSVKSALSRLYRVAQNEGMRKVVWKRLLGKDLLWTPSEQILLIETHAAECGLGLGKPKHKPAV